MRGVSPWDLPSGTLCSTVPRSCFRPGATSRTRARIVRAVWWPEHEAMDGVEGSWRASRYALRIPCGACACGGPTSYALRMFTGCSTLSMTCSTPFAVGRTCAMMSLRCALQHGMDGILQPHECIYSRVDGSLEPHGWLHSCTGRPVQRRMLACHAAAMLGSAPPAGLVGRPSGPGPAPDSRTRRRRAASTAEQTERDVCVRARARVCAS
jgi:hypothetical protein